jgi:hypothetical protein
VRNTVENVGFSPAPLMQLYHMNFGWPLVDDGATLEAVPHTVTPQTPHAAAAVDAWTRATPLSPASTSRSITTTCRQPPTGWPSMRIVNPKLGITVRVSYRTAELPYLIQ